MLQDILGILRLAPDGFPSNMMYHANKTYERISRWIKYNWKSFKRYNTPNDLLLEIQKSEGRYESYTGTKCYNSQIYSEDINEKVDFNLKEYYYDIILDDMTLSMQWKHFFAYVLDYSIEKVYNASYKRHFIDLIKLVWMCVSSDVPDVINSLATNLETANLSSNCNNISEELYLQRVYISRYLRVHIDVHNRPGAVDFRFDFMVERRDKERYGMFGAEEFTYESSDLSDLQFKELIETRTRAISRFQNENLYTDTVD